MHVVRGIWSIFCIKIGSISPVVCDALRSHIPSDPPANHRHHLYDLHAHQPNL
jgi:hypothetical protein